MRPNEHAKYIENSTYLVGISCSVPFNSAVEPLLAVEIIVLRRVPCHISIWYTSLISARTVTCVELLTQISDVENTSQQTYSSTRQWWIVLLVSI